MGLTLFKKRKGLALFKKRASPSLLNDHAESDHPVVLFLEHLTSLNELYVLGSDIGSTAL